MYGGVSLAVYINGVAQEFYHAVQGNGVYRLIKELTDSEIVLDIASGSSAGGINGILLAYALCNGKDFTRSADLWRNAADIQRLIRPTADRGAPVQSVLDSEGYYQSELERAFRLLDASTARAEAPSPIKELDLFVTGTHLDGRTYQRVDSEGHLLDVKDYRAVFQLKYRQGRKSNFDATRNPAVHIALSKLARITSCFPGAFSPVFVPISNIEGKSEDRMSANELLQYWGQLSQPTYMIDGGVIDNKPFTHTIREIFFRTAERKIDRKLFYIEPDPERFKTRDPDFIPDPPTFASPIISSLIDIPGYESIAEDLKLLSARNESVREYNRLLQDIAQLYATRETVRYGVGIPSIQEPQRSIYSRARCASLSHRVLEGVFRNATFESSPDLNEQRTALIREFDRRTANADDILRAFDVLFRLRRTFHLIFYVYDLMYSEQQTPLAEEAWEQQRQRYLPVLKRLNQQIELWNVLYAAMERLVDSVDYGWKDSEANDASAIWTRVMASMRMLLHGDGLREHLSDLRTLNSVLRRRIDQCKTSIFDVPNFETILVAADAEELAFLEEVLEPTDPVLQRYFHFNSMDAHLFPIEWVSGLGERNEIEVCRVSPLDAQRGFSDRAVEEKTAGRTLAHFSGFFKKTWRSNDIMWGRLDGLCELTETLLTGDAIVDAMDRGPARQRARAVLLPEDGTPSPLSAWFRDSSVAAIDRIKNWVSDITSEDPEQRRRAASVWTNVGEGQSRSTRELLIEMAQFQVLHECLPQVFEDSISEQAAASQVRRRSRRDAERLQWLGADVAVDGAALQALSAVGGKKLVEEIEAGRPAEESPRDSRLGQTFVSNYRVGSEEVFSGGVPPLVLADIFSRGALVVRNCLLGTVSQSAGDKVRANSFYRWAIDVPLRALRGLVVFLRAAPRFQAALFVGVTLLSILALFVGLNWQDAILRPGGQLDFIWFGVFIVVPAVWLSFSAFQFGRSGLRRTRLTDTARNVFAFLCMASPLISVTLLYFGLTDLVMDWWSGTAEPVGDRNMQILMVLLYGIVPFVLSFIGGYLAVRSGRRELGPDDYVAMLERITESELQDVSDRLGEQHRVTSESRRDVAKALTVAAEMTNNMGKLDRAIRATCPGLLD
jgi:predicted acylesterase/phospholipase RssA